MSFSLSDIENKTFLYPTDTILGLGCSVHDVDSIKKIYEIKQRPNDKSLIILVNSETMLQQLVDVPEMAWELIDVSDKPITLVYDNPKNLPKELIFNDNSIAIRFTKDAFCSKIINTLKAPIVSTSANISGEKNPTVFTEVSAQIREKVDYIFPECMNFVPKYSASSIIKISVDNKIKILRV